MTHTVEILVEKRTFKPAGWKNLRTFVAECRLTPKRIYTGKGYSQRIYSRETGEEMQPVEYRIHQNYRYAAIIDTIVPRTDRRG